MAETKAPIEWIAQRFGKSISDVMELAVRDLAANAPGQEVIIILALPIIAAD